MSAFVVGVPVPEGLDPRVYRVRVVVDRIDGAALTGEDLGRIEAVYPSKPAPARRARTKVAPPEKPRKTSKARRVRRGSARAA